MGLYEETSMPMPEYAGLNPSSGSSGLLDMLGNWAKDPRNNQTLMAFGANLLSGRKANVGTALNAAMEARNGFDKNEQKKAFQSLQMKKMQSEVDENAAQAAAKQAALARQGQINSLMGGNPAMTLGAQYGDVGPTNTNAERIPQNPMDAYGARASILENAGFMSEGFKLRKDVKDLTPQVEKYETLIGPDGKPKLTALMKDATTKPMTGLSQLDDPNKPFGRTGQANTSYQLYELAKAQAGRSNTNVNLPAPEKAFSVELAKLDAKELDDMRNAATKASSGLARVDEMKRLAKGGVYSGTMAEGRVGVANMFDTLGVPMDTKKLVNSQEYLKHAKELTLSLLKEGVGTNQISNADLKFVNETVPQLETNPQARVNLLNFIEGKLKTSVDKFDRADAYARQNKGLSGFKYQNQRSTDLSTDEEKELAALRSRFKK